MMMHRMQTLIAAMVGFLLLTGCGPDADEKSGGDHQRGIAKELKLGEPTPDSVNKGEGDATDWKFVQVEKPGPLMLNVGWDSPDALEAIVQVVNSFGETIKQLKHDPGKRKESLGPFSVLKGKTFIMVKASDGGSVYTLEVKEPQAGGSSYIPPPE